MKLGELEFKPEDFAFPADSDNSPFFSFLVQEGIANQANRILKEKLEKAPQMFMAKGYGHFDTWREENTELDAPATHTARLVCIEGMGK